MNGFLVRNDCLAGRHDDSKVRRYKPVNALRSPTLPPRTHVLNAATAARKGSSDGR